MNIDFNQSFDEYVKRKRALESKILILDTPIENLPRYKQIKEKIDETCTICFQDFKDDDIIESCIICLRFFHYLELRNWVKKAKTCPICKNEESIQ